MKKLQNSADSTQQYSEQGSDMSQKSNYRLDFSESLFSESNSSQVSLQMITQGHILLTAVAVREAEEDVTMRAELLQLIDIIFIFNLAFFAVTEAAAAS
ncbi:hypothetical protein BDDG_13029 [Blastomyces dermatitidis ATCC 18188]|uniref:Uncharacterized protein n=1 Tax=Ajellomyces dermatitidis (strain ATCC 18188 / CBS 674.68) TaxID=653446 RepID=A0A0J9ER57_AJEDA|nr:hypothetical protein BDDG_13029 [Blastomyces dermatitidis ATCC 18188]